MDDASWVMGFLDIIDPAIDTIKRLLKLDKESFTKAKVSVENIQEINGSRTRDEETSGFLDRQNMESGMGGMDLDAFISEKLSLDPSKLDVQMDPSKAFVTKRTTRPPRRTWRSENTSTTTS